jgi:hypothetical protein
MNRARPVQTAHHKGFTADPDYWKGEVFAYVGSIQNLKNERKHGLSTEQVPVSAFVGS